MADSLTISRSNPSYPDYLDFGRLRAEGIQHVEQLAGKVWTDYNLHDPGITILEVLCYALTDLGYRTQFDIQDLLAQKPGSEQLEDNFFTASQILSCNPVTLMDYRKLLIDIEGVRNAWIFPAEEAEFPLYVNAGQDRLQYFPQQEGSDTRLKMRGIYNVEIELDPVLPADTYQDSCGNESVSVARILREVRAALHRHRNLCTDFMDVHIIGDEPIALCADIELSPNAVPEEVEVQIYQQVQDFFTPPIHFYTLEEMIGQGKEMEEIFAGRPYTLVSHGFVDVEELANSELRNVLNASDLYQVLMDVPGVRGIKNLTLTSYLNEVRQSRPESWRLQLLPGHRPVADIVHSNLTFYKDVLPFRANKSIVRERFEQRLGEFTKTRLKPDQLDRPVPSGRYGELADYTSIQHEFPTTYGIGAAGLPDHVDEARRAQARQLKGYLLFYDQLFANYLAQLSHVRDLFSMRRDQQRSPEARKTYFSQLLQDVPALSDLIVEYQGGADAAVDPCEPQEQAGPDSDSRFTAFLNSIAEGDATYFDRRNRFLDHMLSRFSETFTDYVLLMYAMSKERHDDQILIDDKSDFLQNYAQISRDRGKGADYTNPEETWDTDNVSGLEMRVSKLMGVADHRRRNLCNFEVIYRDERYTVQLKGPEEEVLLMGLTGFADQAAAEAEIKSLWQLAREARQYYLLDCEEESTYGFGLTDQQGEKRAFHPHTYDRASERDAARYQLINYALTSRADSHLLNRLTPWHFRLRHEAGEGIWESSNGYAAPQQAWEGVQEVFARAADRAHYRKLDNDPNSQYAFELKSDPGVLATHPQHYHSSRRRESAIQAALIKVQQAELFPDIVQLTDTFGFEWKDDKGNPICESVYRFAEAGQTVCAYNRFILLARQEHAYRPIDDPANCAFSFEIWNEDQIVLAKASQVYGSRTRRDVAIRNCLELAARPDQLYGIYASRDESYRFDVSGVDCRSVLPSKYNYAEEEQAVCALEELLSLAQDRAYYQPISRTVNRRIEVIAPGLVEETLSERREWPVKGAIHWTEEKTLRETLNETLSRYIRPTATGTVVEVINRTIRREGEADEAAVFPESTCYSFNLVNEEGMVVTHHTNWYTTVTARESAITGLIDYLTCEGFMERILLHEGPFRFRLMDKEGAPVWIGEQEYAAAESAVVAANEGILLARTDANYEALCSTGACRQGYRLLDGARNPVARNPHFFDKRSGKRALQQQRIRLIQQACKTEVFAELRQDVANYFFAYPMQEVLRDEQGYPSPIAAEKAFEAWLQTPAAIEQLGDYAELAQSIHADSSGRLFDRLNRERYRLEVMTLPAQFRYRVKDELGQEILVSTAVFSSRQAAAEAFQSQFMTAIQEPENWINSDDPEARNFSFFLQNSFEKKTLATLCRGFSEPENRDRLRWAFVSYLHDPDAEILWEMETLPLRYGYRLLDLTHVSVSSRGYEKQGEALGAFYEYLQLAPRPEKHTYWQYQDEPNRYLHTTGAYRQAPLAHGVRAYDDRREGEEQERVLAELLQHQVVTPTTQSVLLDEAAAPYYYQLVDTHGAPMIRSAVGYSAEIRAWEAAETQLIAIGDAEAYRFFRPFTTSCGYQLEITAPDSQETNSSPWAIGQVFDESLEDARKTRDRMIRQVNQEGFHVLEHLLLRPTNRGSELTYAFQLTGIANRQLWVSAKGYATQEEAWVQYQKMRELAKREEAYQPTDTEDYLGRRLYGFCLNDELGQNVLARHPHQYYTADRRNAVIDEIREFLSGPDAESAVAVKHVFYSFQQLDPISHEVKSEEPTQHLDRRAAERAYSAFRQSTLFGPTFEVKMIDYPEQFRQQLTDEAGEESLACMERAEGQFSVLLISEASYNTAPAPDDLVVADFLKAVRTGVYDPFQDEVSEEFGFRLLDQAGNLIADHGGLYATAKERDYVLDEVRNYLDTYLVAIESDPEKKGLRMAADPPAFGLEVIDERKDSVLMDAARYESKAAARHGYLNLVHLLADPARYVNASDEGAGNEHTFSIAGRPLVKSIVFDQESTRDTITQQLLQFGRQEVLPHAVLRRDAAYLFRIPNALGEIVWESAETYPSQADARAAYEQAVNLLKTGTQIQDKSLKDGEQALFSFELHADGAVWARHVYEYADVASRDAIKAVAIAEGKGMKPDPERDVYLRPDTWYFELQVASGESLLTGTASYPTIEMALEAYRNLVSLLADGSRFQSDQVTAVEDLAVYGVSIGGGMEDLSLGEAMARIQLFVQTGGFPYRIEKKQGFYARIYGPDGQEALRGKRAFDTVEDALAEQERMLELAKLNASYAQRMILPDASSEPLYSFLLVDEQGEIATHAGRYASTLARDQAMAALLDFLNDRDRIFLRPILEGDKPASQEAADLLMPISVSEREMQSTYFPENIDPYSNLATVVLPYWPRRFRDVNFRNFFENTLRREVAAHVALRIVWVNLQQMREFETLYKKWLADKALPYQSCSQTRSLNDLIRSLSSLNNIFPLATLYDAANVGDNPVILNHTMLGSVNT